MTTFNPMPTALAKAMGLTATALFLAGCSVTPQPMSKLDNVLASQVDLQTLQGEAQVLEGEVGLNEAIARAMKYNRSRRVALMNTTLASAKLDGAHFDMLPGLTAKAGYSERSKHAVSSSGTYDESTRKLTAVNPPAYSGGADKTSHTADLTATWNVLDFGLSYVRAEQQADRVLIAQERERKAIHNLIIDVRTAYWRAASAQKLLLAVTPLRERVRLALADAQQVEDEQLQSPLQALTYQRDLLDISRSLNALHKDLRNAKTELATLMGLNPNQEFDLPDIADSGYEVLDVNMDTDTLEVLALANRPELKESRYSTRVTQAEGRAALLALLPGINLNYAMHLDENPYLLYNEWNDWGATMNVNLFNIFKSGSVKRQSASSNAVAEAQRLALTAAVISQVHLSLIGYQQAREDFDTATEYLAVMERINQQMQDQREAGSGTELQLIREEMNLVLAQLRRDVAYGEVQNGYGRVFTTSGLDPIPSVQDDSIESISTAIDTQLERWKDGRLGLLTAPLQDQVSAWKGAGDHNLALSQQSFLLGGDVAYQASLANGDDLPDWLTFDPETMTFSGNPPASLSKLDINVAANNQHGTTANDSFAIDLVDTNDKPTAGQELTLRIAEDSEQVKGEVPAADADGDKLEYAIASQRGLPPGFSITKEGVWSLDTSSADFQHLAQGKEAHYTASIAITDPYGGNAENKLGIVVTGVNDEPVVVLQPEMTLTEGDKPLKGKLQANDVDQGDRLTWSIASNKIPSGYSLSRQGVYTFDPRVKEYDSMAAGDFRTLVVVVEVADNYGGKVNMPLQFTMAGSNDAPVATHKQVADITLDAGNDYVAKLPSDLFTDPEGQKLTLSAAVAVGGFATEELPSWLIFDGDKGRFEADISAVSESTAVRLQITATDPEGASVSSKLNVQVIVK